MTAPVALPALGVGDRVQAELLVRERHEKSTSGGDPFWILTLGNRSGAIDTAPVWHNQAALVEGAGRGAFVQVIGTVREYKGKRQLEVTSLRVLPPGGFDVRQFLPSEAPDRIEHAWHFLDTQIAALKSEPLRRAAQLFFGDAGFRERFELAPGSTGGHHASVGGLLVHTYEVARIAQHIAKTMRANADLAFVGALLHDVGKVEAYEIREGNFAFTPGGQLAGHIVQGSWMLQERLLADPSHGLSALQVLELQHFILSHHGSLEFGAAAPPMTPEAEIVHWADEASAKANDMLEASADASNFTGDEPQSTKRVFRVGKRIWRTPAHW